MWTLLALVGSSAMARSYEHWGSQKLLLTGKPIAVSQVAPPSTDWWIVPVFSPVAARTVTTAPTLLIASIAFPLTNVVVSGRVNVRVNVGDTLPPTEAVPAFTVRQIPAPPALLVDSTATRRLFELPGSNTTCLPRVVLRAEGTLATNENTGVAPSAVSVK